MKDLTIFTTPTAERILNNLKISKNNSYGGKSMPTKQNISAPNGYFYGKLISNDENGLYQAKPYWFDDTAEDVANHRWIPLLGEEDGVEYDTSDAVDVYEVNKNSTLAFFDYENVEAVDDTSGIYRFTESIAKNGFKWIFQTPVELLHYFEITSSVDENEYVANIYDNPTDRNLLKEDVTVYAHKHTLGVYPNSIAGKGEFAYLNPTDNKYYLIYQVFLAG